MIEPFVTSGIISEPPVMRKRLVPVVQSPAVNDAGIPAQAVSELPAAKNVGAGSRLICTVDVAIFWHPLVVLIAVTV